MAKHNAKVRAKSANPAKSALIGGRTHGQKGAQHVKMSALSGAPARAAEVLHDTATGTAPTRSSASNSAMSETSSTPMRAKTRRDAAISGLKRDGKKLLKSATRVGSLVLEAGRHPERLAEVASRAPVVHEVVETWNRRGERTTPVALRTAREDAAQLKTDLLAAGRFLLRKDPSAQRELDLIAQGEGLADLIDDLKELAEFYGRRADQLKDADVPSEPSERARDLARRLTIALAREELDSSHSALSSEPKPARGKLAQRLSDLRALGRYARIGVPAWIELFRHDLEHTMKNRVAEAAKKASPSRARKAR